MPLADPTHPLLTLVKRDTRYTVDAYLFVLEALTYAQESLGLGEEPPEADREQGREKEASEGRSRQRRKRSERHLTGQQLCEAARHYALEQYGYLAKTVLGTWGVSTTRDLGEIVFNMIDIGQMRKTRKDRREDFHDVYDFEDVFRDRFSFAMAESP
jgi:uncharacterized repeat protein (TIGR04138 family)